ncbi:hypothetical protein AB6A40_005828 [Gnathostoma spinigerum]|uniref:G-protein coupled receptors family 1 profile domain-containing protein n=1 Tax=Gnathostoma spinigerum TaxID=75299 RepID=A0ABD6ELU1_9BILA
MVVVITAQRFRAVSKPFLSMDERHCGTVTIGKRSLSSVTALSVSAFTLQNIDKQILVANKISLLLVLFAIVFNLPVLFEIQSVLCHDNTTVLLPTAMRSTLWYKLFYRALLKNLLETIGPFVTVFIMTLLTIVAIQKNRDSHSFLMCPKGDSLIYRRYSARLSCYPIGEPKFVALRLRTAEITANFCIVTIAVKFLCFHSLVAALDIWEALFYINVAVFNNAVAVSNFFVLLDAASNCFVFVGLRFLRQRISSFSFQRS